MKRGHFDWTIFVSLAYLHLNASNVAGSARPTKVLLRLTMRLGIVSRVRAREMRHIACMTPLIALSLPPPQHHHSHPHQPHPHTRIHSRALRCSTHSRSWVARSSGRFRSGVWLGVHFYSPAELRTRATRPASSSRRGHGHLIRNDPQSESEGELEVSSLLFRFLYPPGSSGWRVEVEPMRN